MKEFAPEVSNFGSPILKAVSPISNFEMSAPDLGSRSMSDALYFQSLSWPMA